MRWGPFCRPMRGMSHNASDFVSLDALAQDTHRTYSHTQDTQDTLTQYMLTQDILTQRAQTHTGHTQKEGHPHRTQQRTHREHTGLTQDSHARLTRKTRKQDSHARLARRTRTQDSHRTCADKKITKQPMWDHHLPRTGRNGRHAGGIALMQRTSRLVQFGDCLCLRS